MIKQYDELFKIVIVGSQGVGKSGIFLRFSQGSFYQNYTATIGVDFRFKVLEIDNRQCKLQIWDTAGQQRFRSITSAYYRGAHAVIIVYDLSNAQSFQQLKEYWIEQVKLNIPPNSLIILMGTKSDLQRKTSSEAINQLKQRLNLKAYQVSSKTGQGILQSFQDLCRDLIKLNITFKTSKASFSQQERTRRGCC